MRSSMLHHSTSASVISWQPDIYPLISRVSPEDVLSSTEARNDYAIIPIENELLCLPLADSAAAAAAAAAASSSSLSAAAESLTSKRIRLSSKLVSLWQQQHHRRGRNHGLIVPSLVMGGGRDAAAHYLTKLADVYSQSECNCKRTQQQQQQQQQRCRCDSVAFRIPSRVRLRETIPLQLRTWTNLRDQFAVRGVPISRAVWFLRLLTAANETTSSSPIGNTASSGGLGTMTAVNNRHTLAAKSGGASSYALSATQLHALHARNCALTEDIIKGLDAAINDAASCWIMPNQHAKSTAASHVTSGLLPLQHSIESCGLTLSAGVALRWPVLERRLMYLLQLTLVDWSDGTMARGRLVEWMTSCLSSAATAPLIIDLQAMAIAPTQATSNTVRLVLLSHIFDQLLIPITSARRYAHRAFDAWRRIEHRCHNARATDSTSSSPDIAKSYLLSLASHRPQLLAALMPHSASWFASSSSSTQSLNSNESMLQYESNLASIRRTWLDSLNTEMMRRPMPNHGLTGNMREDAIDEDVHELAYHAQPIIDEIEDCNERVDDNMSDDVMGSDRQLIASSCSSTNATVDHPRSNDMVADNNALPQQSHAVNGVLHVPATCVRSSSPSIADGAHPMHPVNDSDCDFTAAAVIGLSGLCDADVVSISHQAAAVTLLTPRLLSFLALAIESSASMKSSSPYDMSLWSDESQSAHRPHPCAVLLHSLESCRSSELLSALSLESIIESISLMYHDPNPITMTSLASSFGRFIALATSTGASTNLVRVLLRWAIVAPPLITYQRCIIVAAIMRRISLLESAESNHKNTSSRLSNTIHTFIISFVPSSLQQRDAATSVFDLLFANECVDYVQFLTQLAISGVLERSTSRHGRSKHDSDWNSWPRLARHYITAIRPHAASASHCDKHSSISSQIDTHTLPDHKHVTSSPRPIDVRTLRSAVLGTITEPSTIPTSLLQCHISSRLAQLVMMDVAWVLCTEHQPFLLIDDAMVQSSMAMSHDFINHQQPGIHCDLMLSLRRRLHRELEHGSHWNEDDMFRFGALWATRCGGSAGATSDIASQTDQYRLSPPVSSAPALLQQVNRSDSYDVLYAIWNDIRPCLVPQVTVPSNSGCSIIARGGRFILRTLIELVSGCCFRNLLETIVRTTSEIVSSAAVHNGGGNENIMLLRSVLEHALRSNQLLFACGEAEQPSITIAQHGTKAENDDHSMVVQMHSLTNGEQQQQLRSYFDTITQLIWREETAIARQPLHCLPSLARQQLSLIHASLPSALLMSSIFQAVLDATSKCFMVRHEHRCRCPAVWQECADMLVLGQLLPRPSNNPSTAADITTNVSSFASALKQCWMASSSSTDSLRECFVRFDCTYPSSATSHSAPPDFASLTRSHLIRFLLLVLSTQRQHVEWAPLRFLATMSSDDKGKDTDAFIPMGILNRVLHADDDTDFSPASSLQRVNALQSVAVDGACADLASIITLALNTTSASASSATRSLGVITSILASPPISQLLLRSPPSLVIDLLSRCPPSVRSQTVMSLLRYLSSSEDCWSRLLSHLASPQVIADSSTDAVPRSLSHVQWSVILAELPSLMLPWATSLLSPIVSGIMSTCDVSQTSSNNETRSSQSLYRSLCRLLVENLQRFLLPTSSSPLSSSSSSSSSSSEHMSHLSASLDIDCRMLAESIISRDEAELWLWCPLRNMFNDDISHVADIVNAASRTSFVQHDGEHLPRETASRLASISASTSCTLSTIVNCMRSLFLSSTIYHSSSIGPMAAIVQLIDECELLLFYISKIHSEHGADGGSKPVTDATTSAATTTTPAVTTASTLSAQLLQRLLFRFRCMSPQPVITRLLRSFPADVERLTKIIIVTILTLYPIGTQVDDHTQPQQLEQQQFTSSSPSSAFAAVTLSILHTVLDVLMHGSLSTSSSFHDRTTMSDDDAEVNVATGVASSSQCSSMLLNLKDLACAICTSLPLNHPYREAVMLAFENGDGCQLLHEDELYHLPATTAASTAINSSASSAAPCSVDPWFLHDGFLSTPLTDIVYQSTMER